MQPSSPNQRPGHLLSADGPMVSVVMPSFNQAKFIDESISSVLSQGYPRLELIVADGGSSDGTVERLRVWSARDRRLRYFSGPDTGPADALNKALARTRGTFIGWLNSDDLYTPGAIERAVAALESNPEWLSVYGHGEHVDEEGLPIGRYPTIAPPVTADLLGDHCFICQPTLFFRRTLNLLLGPLDANLKAVFDLEYWLRMFTHVPARVGFVDALQAQSRLHSASITLRMRRTIALEAVMVLHRHLGVARIKWLEGYASELAGSGTSDASNPTQLQGLLQDAKPYLTRDQHHLLERLWQTNTVKSVAS